MGGSSLKLLLDTHVLLWSLLDPGQLSPRAVSKLEDPRTELWLSPITTWEVIILSEKGRISLNALSAKSWMRQVFDRLPFKEARLNHEVAIASRSIDLNHNDPADRFIAASALIYNLVLMTADRHILASQQIQTLNCKSAS